MILACSKLWAISSILCQPQPREPHRRAFKIYSFAVLVCRSLSLRSKMFTLNARQSMLHSTSLMLDAITYLWHYRPGLVVDKSPGVLVVPLDCLHMLIEGNMCDTPVLFQACASVVSPRERRGQAESVVCDLGP